MNILQPSYQSLFLSICHKGLELGVATGFIINTDTGLSVLITNRHVVTGRHQDSGEILNKYASEPTELTISHNRHGSRGRWIKITEQLYDESKPRWYEHPNLKEYADVIALPLTEFKNIDLIPYQINKKLIMQHPKPADRVSVVGFPYGLSTGGGYAIWTTGFVASEPDTEKPYFLIDCRTKTGQSGSPVIAHSNGGAVMVDGGGVETRNEVITDFLGVYSGRKNEGSDLGVVWKSKILKELIFSVK